MSLLRLTWAGLVAILIAGLFACLTLVLQASRNYAQQDLQARHLQIVSELAFYHAQQPDLQAFMDQMKVRSARESWHLLQVFPTGTTPPAMSAGKMTLCKQAAWFCSMVKLDSRPSTLVLGDMSVQFIADPASAYSQMWAAACNVLIVFFGMGLVLVTGAFFLNRWAFRPLQGIYDQLEGIGMGRFEHQPQSVLIDWHPLTRILNIMVGRIKSLLHENSASLSSIRDELEYDALTRFFNRGVFVEQLTKAVARAGHTTGTVVLIRINDLLGMNQKMGRERTDDFLTAVSTLIRAKAYIFGGEDVLFGRLNSSDFAVFFPQVDPDGEKTGQWLNNMSQALADLHHQSISDSSDIAAWMTATACRPNEDLNTLLIRLDSLVIACENQRKKYLVESPEQNLHAMPFEQWRILIEDALETGALEMDYAPVYTQQGTLLHRHLQLWIHKSGSAPIDVNVFRAPALRTGRIVNLDIAALDMAEQMLVDEKEHDYALSVSVASIKRPVFLKRLEQVLQQGQFNTQRLCIEIDDFGLQDSLDDFKRLAQVIKPFACKLGIGGFGKNFSTLLAIENIGLDYIRLDASLGQNIAYDKARQALIQLAVSLSHNLGIKFIASYPASQPDMEELTRLGIDGFLS